MKHLLFTLWFLCALSISAKPNRATPAVSPFPARVVIVTGGESYPGLLGLTGAPPHTASFSAMTIWSVDGTTRRLAFNLELANIGGSAWSPLNINPARVIPDESFYDLPMLVDFFRYSLVDAQGNVVAERVSNTIWWLWDQFALVPFSRQMFGVGMPGIARGRAAQAIDRQFSETWLDITDAPDGDYTLVIESDQANDFGQYDRVEVPMRIKAYSITLL